MIQFIHLYTTKYHIHICQPFKWQCVLMCLTILFLPYCIMSDNFTSPLIRASKLSVMFSHSAMQLHSQLTAKICQTISKFCHNFSQSNRTSPLPNYDIIYCVNYIVLYSSEQTMVKCYLFFKTLRSLDE